MWIIGLEGEEFIDIFIHFIFFKLLSLVIYYAHLTYHFFYCYFMVLTQNIPALFDEGSVGNFIVFNIKDKELQHKIQGCNQVL